MKVVVLTGSELRHAFVRKAIALADGIEVVRSFCEGTRGCWNAVSRPVGGGGDLQHEHIAMRERSEQDFFGPFDGLCPDTSSPRYIEWGEARSQAVFEEITALAPDLIACFGCSILKDPLLSAYQGRILNVHLGLSPHYRGAGTNYWPLVNGEPEFVGATFMYLDAGVDTGEIIHQVRARIFPADTPHQIGNRLIADMTRVYVQVIRAFAALERMDQPPVPDNEHYYRTKDYSPESVETLYRRFGAGLVDAYLAEREAREAAAPIVENPAVAPEAR